MTLGGKFLFNYYNDLGDLNLPIF